MKITIKVKKEFEVKYLKAKCGVRYWEDATVNGEEDKDGVLIPCRDGDYWCPIIDIETGLITNWLKGHEASIHYKVCDDGEYSLLDSDMGEIITIADYVPKMLCPKRGGYGDYVIMDVDRDGKIIDWKANLTEFEEFEEG